MSNFKGPGGNDLPDPKELMRKLRGSSRFLWYIGALIALVVLATQSYFTVEADERAVVLRLGKPTGELSQPGLHFKVPLIDQVFKASTTRIRQLEFGFRTQEAGVQSRVDERLRAEGLMLTGDLELVNVQWTVLYRISDLQAYLFNVRNVEKTIRDISESTIRLLVGDRSSDEVMTRYREEIASSARDIIQESLNRVDSGIDVESVALRQVDPPAEAADAFNKVNEARARKQQAIEKAKREKESLVSPMRGKKDAIISEARGLRDRLVKEAEGEAQKFLAILEEYRKAPEVTMRWLYLETMQRVWQRAGRKYMLDDTAEGNTIRLLPLGDLSGAGLSPSRSDASPRRDMSRMTEIPVPTSGSPDSLETNRGATPSGRATGGTQ